MWRVCLTCAPNTNQQKMMISYVHEVIIAGPSCYLCRTLRLHFKKHRSISKAYHSLSDHIWLYKHVLLSWWDNSNTTRELDSGVREIQQKFSWFCVRVRLIWFRITIERIILVRCWFHVQVTLVIKKRYLWVKSTPHIPGLAIYTPRARPPSLSLGSRT